MTHSGQPTGRAEILRLRKVCDKGNVTRRGLMTSDEQRRVRAENLILLEDKEEELRCCHLKGKAM